MQRRSVAYRCEPEKANFPLSAQSLKRWDDFAKHLLDAERRPATSFGDGVVQVENVDVVPLQTHETIIERFGNRVGDAAIVSARQADLGADNRVAGFQVLQNAAEVLFRLAVAVLHRRVEVIHADFECAGDGALLIARIAAHHQSADRAAAEAEHRYLHACAAVDAHFHRNFSRPDHINGLPRISTARSIFTRAPMPVSAPTWVCSRGSSKLKILSWIGPLSCSSTVP
jgi:hypothetical protein